MFFLPLSKLSLSIKKEVNKLQLQIIDYNLRVGPKVSAP